MKRRFMFGVAMASVSVVIVVSGVWIIRLQSVDDTDTVRLAELEKIPSQGERLNISALRQDERVEVQQIMRRHMWWEALHYVIEGGEPRFTVQKSDLRHERGYGLRAGKLLETRAGKLAQIDAIGLDKFLDYLRLRIPADLHHYDTFEVSYFRASKKIGSENFIIDQYWSRPEGYDSLPSNLRTRYTESDWVGIRTFERLEVAEPASPVATTAH